MPVAKNTRSCTQQSTSKYTKRKSPPFPANECGAQQKRGNDGEMYESRADKRGVFRWYKVKATTKAASKPRTAVTQKKSTTVKDQPTKECAKQTTAKYAKRKSPPFPANECPGEQKTGNDGLLYESRPDKNNVHRWYKVKSTLPLSKSPSHVSSLQSPVEKSEPKCVQQTTAKYTKRKSPPFPANECPGAKKIGNDGLWYESRPDKNNVHRWYKVPTKGVQQEKRKPQEKKTGCVKQTTAKYAKRKSPPFPANECCGKRKKGNDGTMYVSVPDKNNVCRWKKVSTRANVSQKRSRK